ncbi:MAG: precorrin-2 C(20)-methyltransferase [Halanaerobiales bacterium]
MTKKLYGIGVGPGDPELLTIKAKKILEKVDIIYTPISSKGKESRALGIITDIINRENTRIEKLLFPMSKNKNVKEKYWQKNSKKINSDLDRVEEVAYITIGDPLFYSTYIYILDNIKKQFPEINIETIPGITSISAGAARFNIPLAQKKEKLMILPDIPDIIRLKNIIEEFDNIVILKVSRNYEKLIELLEEFNLKDNFVFISECGYPQEFITCDIEELKNNKIEYLSLVICKQGKNISEYISREELR